MRVGVVICHLQQKSLPNIQNNNYILKNAHLLISASHQIPNIKKTVVSELLPEKLGRTDGTIVGAVAMNKIDIIPTNNYSAYTPELDEMFQDHGINNLIIAGVQTEWCIMKTAKDFIKKKYIVHIPVDAVGTQGVLNQQYGLKRLFQYGAYPCTTKGIISELLDNTTLPSSKWYINMLKSER